MPLINGLRAGGQVQDRVDIRQHAQRLFARRGQHGADLRGKALIVAVGMVRVGLAQLGKRPRLSAWRPPRGPPSGQLYDRCESDLNFLSQEKKFGAEPRATMDRGSTKAAG